MSDELSDLIDESNVWERRPYSTPMYPLGTGLYPAPNYWETIKDGLLEPVIAGKSIFDFARLHIFDSPTARQALDSDLIAQQGIDFDESQMSAGERITDFGAGVLPFAALGLSARGLTWAAEQFVSEGFLKTATWQALQGGLIRMPLEYAPLVGVAAGESLQVQNNGEVTFSPEAFGTNIALMTLTGAAAAGLSVATAAGYYGVRRYMFRRGWFPKGSIGAAYIEEAQKEARETPEVKPDTEVPETSEVKPDTEALETHIKKLQAQKSELEGAEDDYKNKIVELQNDIKTSETKQIEHENIIKELESKRVKLKRDNKKRVKTLEKLKNTTISAKARKIEREKAIKNLKIKKAKLEKANEKGANELKTLNDAIKKHTYQADALKKTIKEGEAKRTKLQNAANDLNAQKEKLENDIKKHKEDKDKLESDKAKLESHKAKLESDKAKLESDKAKFKSDEVKLKSDKAKLESRKAKLENRKAKLESDKAKLESDEVKKSDEQPTETLSEPVKDSVRKAIENSDAETVKIPRPKHVLEIPQEGDKFVSAIKHFSILGGVRLEVYRAVIRKFGIIFTTPIEVTDEARERPAKVPFDEIPSHLRYIRMSIKARRKYVHEQGLRKIYATQLLEDAFERLRKADLSAFNKATHVYNKFFKLIPYRDIKAISESAVGKLKIKKDMGYQTMVSHTYQAYFPVESVLSDFMEAAERLENGVTKEIYQHLMFLMHISLDSRFLKIDEIENDLLLKALQDPMSDESDADWVLNDVEKNNAAGLQERFNQQEWERIADDIVKKRGISEYIDRPYKPLTGTEAVVQALWHNSAKFDELITCLLEGGVRNA